MTPLVLAHRGACWEAPENTLEAFELAIAEGADYVEFDVRAGNGELVICHDPGPPDDVPTLEEVLAALTGRIGLCVEVKEEERTDAVLDALESHAVRPEELIVVSFQVGAVRRVAERRPEIRCVLHTHEPEEAAGCWGVGFEEPAGARRIAAAQAAGLATTVFTVNDPERMLELSALGVTGIFTDRPALARQTLQAAR
ncbi:MAG TPA: glycerophosphodiester phosphodiesterase [Gaiellaceae bacterium]|nr:glycerophosphodiester phosphodiesterase [Gaiellaceae bacterium]